MCSETFYTYSILSINLPDLYSLWISYIIRIREKKTMCGRFVQLATLKAQLSHIFNGVELPTLKVSYNIAPTQPALILHALDNHIKGDYFQWGLIPSWAKEEKIGQSLINSRVETIRSKPSFKDSFEQRRCIVPISGFYEWVKQGSQKQPHYIYPSEGLFLLAGIWSVWAREGTNKTTFSIVTQESHPPIEVLHHRQPLLLDEKRAKKWLDHSEPILNLAEFIGVSQDIEYYPVSPYLNSPAHNSKECLEPIQNNLLF